MATTITEIYQNELGRAPDAGGLDFWQGQLESGNMTIEQIEQAINASGEGRLADPTQTVGVNSNTGQVVNQADVDAYVTEMVNNPNLSDEEKNAAIYEAAKAFNVPSNSVAQSMQAATGDTSITAAVVDDYVAQTQTSALRNATTDAIDVTTPTGMTTAQAEEFVRQQYGTIGRSGIGTDVSQIDQEGFDYWVNQLTTGGVNADQVQNAFEAAAQDYITTNPDDEYSKYVAGLSDTDQYVLPNTDTTGDTSTGTTTTTTTGTGTGTTTGTTTGTGSGDTAAEYGVGASDYSADGTVAATKIDTTGTTAAAPTQQTAASYTADTVTDATGVDAPSTIKTTGYNVTTTAEDVGKALEKIEPVTGTVSAGAQATAATADPRDSAVMEVDTPQIGQAQTVKAPDALQVKDEELVSSAVDMDKAESLAKATEAAAVTGQVSELGTVQGQMSKLMSDFDASEPPAWAAGALRSATAALAARGLSASSMAGQAIVQAAMEAATPIAQADAKTIASFDLQNLSNRQQAAMLAAEQRANFLQLDFNQQFQARVANAARIADVANRNFDANVQIALENSRMAQSVDIANLDAKKAVLIQQMAHISSIETQNLSNLQQAAVQNANAFLQMDLTNIENKQATTIFKAEARIKAILDDANVKNVEANFEASSENEAAIKYQELATSAAIANAEQQNSIKVANMNATNEAAKAKAQAENDLKAAYMKIEADIAQTNATIAADLARADATNATNAAIQTAANLTDLNQTELNNQMQLERDLISQAHTSAENDLDRATDIAAVILNTQSAEEIAKIKADADTSRSIGSTVVDILKTVTNASTEETKK